MDIVNLEWYNVVWWKIINVVITDIQLPQV